MELFLKNRPTTILAGAGLSMPAPTCLPGWWTLNDAVLQALADALDRTTGQPALSDRFRKVVVDRRDHTPFLKPDLQAQLLEDEIGEAYFGALARVDSSDWNGAHDLIAELARQGCVGAIVTTNFDGTIERALDAAGVDHRLFASPRDFEQLEGFAGLAVVKVHGSSALPATLVDTLRQRLHGRPEALSRWMRARFVGFPTLALGFSCEDLQYDPNYLAIRPAVHDGGEFLFVSLNPQPSTPLAALQSDFPGRVSYQSAELPHWLFDAVESSGIQHRIPRPAVVLQDEVHERKLRVTERLAAALADWAASLNRMEVINAVTALLSSAGERQTADYVLRRTWRSWRGPEDCSGPSYARFLCNCGETLIRAARFRNPHDRDKDFAAWHAAADLDPRQFFIRAVTVSDTDVARARLVLCEFLAGKRVPALGPELIAMLTRLNEASGEGHSLSLSLIDATFSLTQVLELCALGQACGGLLDNAHRSAKRLGDEFRRAEAAWRLARNLAFGLVADPAHAERVLSLTTECNEIAARLDIRQSDAGAAVARSIAAGARDEWDAAAAEARRAEDIYLRIEDLLGASFAKRERLRSLIALGRKTQQADAAQWDELSEWLQRFAIDQAPGLRPIVKLELARLAEYFDDTLALQLATDAIEDAALQEHPYIGQAAKEFLRSISGAEPAGT